MRARPELTERILKDGDRVPFTAVTQQYGVAEFRFCLVWRRGKLTEVLIEPMQQPDASERFRLPAPRLPAFCVNAWSHMDVSHPWVWRHFWCPEHGCPAFDLYAPREAAWFQVYHGGDIYFGRDKAGPSHGLDLKVAADIYFGRDNAG
jgi:hypothetical protein